MDEQTNGNFRRLILCDTKYQYTVLFTLQVLLLYVILFVEIIYFFTELHLFSHSKTGNMLMILAVCSVCSSAWRP
jgi:hypothetical protein